MTRGRLGRHRGLLGALLVAAAAVAYQDSRPRPGYTWYELPGFDAHAYAAMAENPAVFTVAPWGYRLLTPWLVHQFRPRDRLGAFHVITLVSLWLAAGLLFLFLRRLGNGEWLSIVAVAAFALSPPVLAAVRMPVMVDPLALLLCVTFLLAVQEGADALVCAALLALGVLAKETTLLLLPLVFLARSEREGGARALAWALVASAPALAILGYQRLVWTPQIRSTAFGWSLATARDTATLVINDWPDVWRRMLLSGLLPLACLGALRRKARPFLGRYGYLAAATLVLPFVAWTNVPSAQRVPFLGDTLQRLLLFTLPFLLPLALIAVDRVWPQPGDAFPGVPVTRGPRLVAAAALAASLAFVVFGLDPYRREPLHETRDGPLVRALCRGSLAVARRLERGEVVLLDPTRHSFEWGGAADPADLYRMRWYLREGWGAVAHYGTGDVAMREDEAALLLPCLTPRDLEVTLAVEAGALTVLDVRLGERHLATLTLAAERQEAVVHVPASALFRGDNRLVLRRRAGPGTPLRLQAIELRPVAPRA
jgi:hypothetical protein